MNIPKFNVSVTFQFPIFSRLVAQTAVGVAVESEAKVCLRGAILSLLVYPNSRIPPHSISSKVKCDAAGSDNVTVEWSLNLRAKSGNNKLQWKDVAITPYDTYYHVASYDTAFRETYCTDDTLTCFVEFTVYGGSPSRQTTTEMLPAAAGNLTSNLAASLLDASYSDMILVVQGERLPVHKVLLCPRSPVFRAMFDSCMKEAATGEVQVGDEFSVGAVTAMLRYLYTDHISAEELEKHSLQLLDLAIYYQLEDLLEYVEKHCATSLDVGNIKQYLQFAVRHDCKELLAAAQQFVGDHSEMLFADSGFLDSLEDREACLLIMKAMVGAAAMPSAASNGWK